MKQDGPGDKVIVRLGYVAYLAVFMGCILPAFTAVWCSQREPAPVLYIHFVCQGENLFWEVLPILNYSLDCADEARQLMNGMGNL